MQRRGFFKTLCAAALALMTPVAAKPAGKVLIACGRPNLNNDVFVPPGWVHIGKGWITTPECIHSLRRSFREEYPDAFNASNVNKSDVR